MNGLPRSVFAAARVQHGVVSVAQLTEGKVVGRARTNALASGLLVPIHRGVYRLGGHPDSFEQRCVAACLAAPKATLSGPTAARLWGLRRVRTDDVHVLAEVAVRLDGVIAHRSTVLDADDVEFRGAMRLLKPLRLACDLAGHLGDDDFESVIEQMLDRKLISIAELNRASETFATAGRLGSERLRRLLGSRPAWLKPVDSDLELRLFRALTSRGLALGRQVALELDSGVTIHFDLADPAIRLAIEVDHATWHGGRRDVERDKRRDVQAMRLGWAVVRVTDADIERRLGDTVAELVAIAERRAHDVARF